MQGFPLDALQAGKQLSVSTGTRDRPEQSHVLPSHAQTQRGGGGSKNK